ncbi:MAG: DUF72 domain-containing protein [Hydrogenobacter sp.]|uniref:DUF72 domain-containing protein n=1 Tax=Hydrogenobacter thermophilus TaxID=940 RepID=UPI0030F66C55
MKVYVGCSGFSYEEWRGVFYPHDLRREEFIIYYSRFFNVLELNFSFYSFPSKGTVKSFLSRSKYLRFSLKAHRIFTHIRHYKSEDVKKILFSIEPVLEEDRFIAMLFQFPESFHRTQENLEYIRKLSEDFRDIEKVVEVRSKSFKSADFYRFLEENGFSLVNSDAPKESKFLVGPWVSIGNINYVRLHGRDPQKPYDYLYSLEELKKLKDRIRKLGYKDTYIFFNNTAKAQAVYNALQMKMLFGIKVEIPKSLQGSLRDKEWE